MANQWFYAQAGQQRGPISQEDLQRLIATGQVGGEDLVWSEGMTNWSPASSVSALIPTGGAEQPPAPVPAPIPAPAPMPGAAPIQYQSSQPTYGVTPPKNYLVQSIIVTLCCCIPFGIVAIVYAAQVNSKFQAGDYAGAQEVSRKANFWGWTAFWCGLAVNIIVVALRVIREM